MVEIERARASERVICGDSDPIGTLQPFTRGPARELVFPFLQQRPASAKLVPDTPPDARGDELAGC